MWSVMSASHFLVFHGGLINLSLWLEDRGRKQTMLMQTISVEKTREQWKGGGSEISHADMSLFIDLFFILLTLHPSPDFPPELIT